MRRKQCCLPALARLLPRYPDIKVELNVDYGLTDIVTERFDAGVRLGEQIAKDMIAVPIGAAMRMAVVGAPSYFARHPAPENAAAPGRSHLHQSAPAHPRRPLCLGVREGRPRKLNVRVEGQLVFNTAGMIVKAALAGMGLACCPRTAWRPRSPKAA